MSIRLMIAVSVCAATFVGCERTPENKTRQDVKATFTSAGDDFEHANAGLVDAETIKSQPGISIDEYRIEKLQAGAAKLENIATKGNAKNQQAARLLLAEVDTSTAITTAADAIRTWSRQAALTTKLMSWASGIRLNTADAEAHKAIDMSEQLAEARGVEKNLVAEKEKLEAQVAKLKSEIKQLSATIDGLDAKKAAKNQEAKKLSGEAFTLSGQARHDKVILANAATTEADQLNAERENNNADRNRKQSELRVAMTYLNHNSLMKDAEGRNVSKLGSIRRAIKNFEERDDSHKKLAQDSRKLADAAEKTFNDDFSTLTSLQADVTAKFDKSISLIDKALADADSALAQASDSTRLQAQLEVASRHVLKGFIHLEQVIIDTGYREMLASVVTAFEPIDNSKLQTIKDAVAAADKQVTETRAASVEAIELAITKVTATIDKAKNSDEAEIESSAIELKIAALRGLATVTGDDSKAADLDSLHARIKELAK